MTSDINRTELLLSLLYADTDQESALDPQNSESVEGITRLEKLLFLLKKKEGFLESVPQNDDFQFVPFRMGPWTEAVYDEVDFLESLGLLSKSSLKKRSIEDQAHNEELFGEGILDKYQLKVSSSSDTESEIFSLTEKGREIAKVIWEKLSEDEKLRIFRVKKRYNKMNLNQFLRYIYKTFPNYSVDSEIKEYLGIQ